MTCDDNDLLTAICVLGYWAGHIPGFLRECGTALTADRAITIKGVRVPKKRVICKNG